MSPKTGRIIIWDYAIKGKDKEISPNSIPDRKLMIRQLNSNEIIKLLGKDFDSQSIDESKNELYVSADQLTNVCSIL